jgi:ligand-binding sensor domain-containing protein
VAAALRPIWLVLCCLALCRCAPGLDRQRTLAEFLHTAWTANEGAPVGIWAIAQTSDGYLWLAAQQGLIRFDGVHFENYQPRRGQLASQQLSALFATPDGGLWIGFRLGGAALLKDGQITNYGAKEGLLSATVFRFALDGEHSLWAATSAGLERLSGATWHPVGADWSYRANSAKEVFVDRAGALWALSNEALFYLPPRARSFREILTTRARDATTGFSGICQTNDGGIWVSHHGTGSSWSRTQVILGKTRFY